MDYDDLVEQFIDSAGAGVGDGDGEGINEGTIEGINEGSNERSSSSSNGTSSVNSNSSGITGNPSTTTTNLTTNTTTTNLTNNPLNIHKTQMTAIWRERDLRRKMFTLEYVKRRNSRISTNLTAANKPPPTNVHSNSGLQERRRQILNLSGGGRGEMIPCRVEIDHDGYKLSDVLLLEEGCTGEAIDLLAGQLTSEYDLPMEPFSGVLSKFLREQVDEFGVFKQTLAAQPIPFAQLPPVAMRVDIIVGLTRLQDRIELALDCEQSAVVSLVNGYSVSELNSDELQGFKPLLLHSLLEQLLMWRKALVFGGWHRDYRTGALKFHDSEVGAVIQEAQSVFGAGTMRRHPSYFTSFTPTVTILSPGELDKIESSRERESRRKRRTQVAPVKGFKQSTQPLLNMLTGSIKSPPRTLATPTSYRGSLHRIVQSKLVDEDEGGVRTKRSRK